MTGLLISRSTTGAMAVNTQGVPGFEVYTTGTNAAYMTFHRAGNYAVRFGLDTDNQLKVGGWSLGNVAYTLYHTGNLNPITTSNIGSQSVNYAKSAGNDSNSDSLGGYGWSSAGKNIRGTEIYADNWFRNYNANEGLYNEATGLHWYSTDAFRMRLFAGSSTTVIQEFATTGGTVRGSIFANDSNQIGFSNNSGNTIWRISSAGSLEVGTVPWARLSGVPTMIHTDTSSQASVNNSGTTVIQDVTLDTYGHVTGLASVTLTSYGDPVYTVSGGTISTAYDRWYRILVSATVYMYIFTGYVTVSSSTGTATIILPISITDGNIQATSGVSSSSGSGGDLVYARMATSSSTATFYVTKDFATSTQGNQVYFMVTGYSSTVL